MPAKAKGNRIVHDLHAIAKDIPAYLGRVYFEDGTSLDSDDVPKPIPLLIMEVNARPDLISFEFEEKVTFEVQLPDNYPAYPPHITYRSATRPGDANRFDQAVIEKHTTAHGEQKALRVTIPLLKHKEDTAWSRTYDLLVVFYALRELFARPESWWLGPVVQGPAIRPNNNRRVYTVAGHHEAQGTRNNMEDAVAVVENTPPPPAPVSYCVYCVLDGHGGHDCSLFTARNLPQLLLRNLAKVPPPKDVQDTSPLSPKAGASVAEEYSKTLAAALYSSLKEVDEAFLEEKLAEASGRGEEEMNFSGSTAMVALFDGRSRLLCASLGDCRAVLSRKGMAVGVSAPEHKANRKDEIARVVKRGGFVAQGRVMGQLAVSRALGDAFYKGVLPDIIASVSNEAEITEVAITLPEDEFVLMACDGLWDVLSSQEVVDFVRARLNNAQGPIDQAFLSETCRALVDEAIGERKSKDNVSVILIRFLEVPPAGGLRSTCFSTADEHHADGWGGGVTSTPSFMVPGARGSGEEPANCLVIGGQGGNRLVSKDSGDSVDEVDDLLRELDGLDDEFAPADPNGSGTLLSPSAARTPPHQPQRQAAGGGAKASHAKALDPVLGGDPELLDFLMDDGNFAP